MVIFPIFFLFLIQLHTARNDWIQISSFAVLHYSFISYPILPCPALICPDSREALMSKRRNFTLSHLTVIRLGIEAYSIVLYCNYGCHDLTSALNHITVREYYHRASNHDKPNISIDYFETFTNSFSFQQ